MRKLQLGDTNIAILLLLLSTITIIICTVMVVCISIVAIIVISMIIISFRGLSWSYLILGIFSSRGRNKKCMRRLPQPQPSTLLEVYDFSLRYVEFTICLTQIWLLVHIQTART